MKFKLVDYINKYIFSKITSHLLRPKIGNLSLRSVSAKNSKAKYINWRPNYERQRKRRSIFRRKLGITKLVRLWLSTTFSNKNIMRKVELESWKACSPLKGPKMILRGRL